MRELRQRQQEIKIKEAKLDAVFVQKEPSEALTWLDGRLKDIRTEKEELSSALDRLEREKQVLMNNQPNPREMKQTLEYVFKNFRKVEPSIQRNFLRQVFDRIEVGKDYKVHLFWRFPELENACDTGGEGFVLANKTGARWGSNPRQPESQSSALPAELRAPLRKNLCLHSTFSPTLRISGRAWSLIQIPA